MKKTHKWEKFPNKTYWYMQRTKVYKHFKLISWFTPSKQSEKLKESRNRHRVTNTKFFITTRTATKLSRATLDFRISHIQLKFNYSIPLIQCCNYLYTKSCTELKSGSHPPKICFCLLQWKPFKNDKKCFLFHVKCSFYLWNI